jgi:hypothetical protein
MSSEGSRLKEFKSSTPALGGAYRFNTGTRGHPVEASPERLAVPFADRMPAAENL